MNVEQTTVILIALLCGTVHCASSVADDAISPPPGGCVTVTAQSLLNVPDMTLRRDIAVGSIIGTTVVTPPIDTFACIATSEQALYIKAYGKPAASIDGLRIYKLGAGESGIGYAVYGNSLSLCAGYKPVIGDSNLGGINVRELCTVQWRFQTQPVPGSMKVVFYKIGEIVSGKYPSQLAGAFAFRTNAQYWEPVESSVRLNAFSVNSLGCSVDNVDVRVPLGEVGMSRLPSAGRTAGEREFSIPLVCDAGTKLSVTIKPGSGGVHDNTLGLLNLTDSSASGSAKGVKVQMLLNNLPVRYNQPLDIGVQTAEGNFDVTLKARYYRTAEPLESGTANSSAIYTITYE